MGCNRQQPLPARTDLQKLQYQTPKKVDPFIVVNGAVSEGFIFFESDITGGLGGGFIGENGDGFIGQNYTYSWPYLGSYHMARGRMVNGKNLAILTLIFSIPSGNITF
jgi:hypothetical protein